MVGGVQSPGPLIPTVDSRTMVTSVDPGVQLQGPHHESALWPARVTYDPCASGGPSAMRTALVLLPQTRYRPCYPPFLHGASQTLCFLPTEARPPPLLRGLDPSTGSLRSPGITVRTHDARGKAKAQDAPGPALPGVMNASSQACCSLLLETTAEPGLSAKGCP